MINKNIAIIKSLVTNVILNNIYVLGDSHTQVFNYMNENYFSISKFQITTVGGASAMGMVNPNSKTNCLEIFSKKISTLPKNAKLIFLLGEVDTGFIIWYRAHKYNLSIEEQFELSLQNYFIFINNLVKRGFKNIILMSAPLPTLKENNPKFGEVAGLRREVKVSQEERTALTLAYNQRLREFCKKKSYQFIDLDHYLLGDNGLIKEVFLNNDLLDHHCDDESFAEVIVRELKDMNLVKWIELKKKPSMV